MSLQSMLFGKLAGGVSHLFMNWNPQDQVKVYLVPLNGGVSIVDTVAGQDSLAWLGLPGY